MFCPQCGLKNRDSAKFCPSCGAKLFFASPPQEKLDNRYLVKSVLKAGGMGSVFLAEDTRLGGEVAIKKMLAPGMDPIERRYLEKRFQEEARLLFSLHHSGLPKVSDYFTRQETGKIAHYLVMTYINGEDLESVMDAAKKPLPLSRATIIFTQIIDILLYLHGQDPPIIYRDLKPSNIMIQKIPSSGLGKPGDPAERVYLIDFGIARLLSPDRSGTIIGTEGYAPPEQFQGIVDQRSDIYALGVVMHYLLTGISPNSPDARHAKYSPVKNANPDVPEALDSLILKMLRNKQTERPQTVTEISDALEKIFPKKNQPARQDSGPLIVKALPNQRDLSSLSKRTPTEPSNWHCSKVLDGFSGSIHQIAISPDASRIASAFHDQIIGLWDASNGSPIRSFIGHEGPVRCVAFSPDGKKIISGSDDQTIRLWDTESGACISTISGREVTYMAIGFSPDGRRFVTGNSDHSVYLWHTSSNVLARTMDRHYNIINSVEFSPDGKFIASASEDGTARIWEASSGNQVQIIHRHESGVRQAKYSKKGDLLATISDDRTVCIWKTDEYGLIFALEGHKDPVRCAAFSPDSKFLISGSDDRTIRLWDVRKGEKIDVMRGHEKPITGIAFLNDGKTLISGSEDGTIRLWKKRTEVASEPEKVKVEYY